MKNTKLSIDYYVVLNMNLKELCEMIIPDTMFTGPQNFFNSYCCAINS